MEPPLKTRKAGGLTTNSLKLIAIFAMLIDHLAWAFVPVTTLHGQVMHIIGRLTAPIMCFFIAEGYYHTKNLKRYVTRLALFSFLSHFAWVYHDTRGLPLYLRDGHWVIYKSTGVIYTLLLGLLALIVYKDKRPGKVAKACLITLLCFLAVPGDWSFIAILWVLAFGANRGDYRKQAQAFGLVGAIMIIGIAVLSLWDALWWRQSFHLGIFLALPLLKQYNGQLGFDDHQKWLKWAFYIFYPLHLIVIGWAAHH